jgi:hypothetical protein
MPKSRDMSDESLAQLSTRIRVDLLRSIKYYCIENDTTMQVFVTEACQTHLRRKHVKVVKRKAEPDPTAA